MSVAHRFIGFALAAGMLAGCGGAGSAITPTLTPHDVLRHTAASARANTPEGRGLGNQKWTDCQNNHEDSGKGNAGLDKGNDKDATAYPNTSTDGGYPPGLNKGGACSSIDLLAPVAAVIDTSAMAPGSSTASATLQLAATASAPCAPYTIGTAPGGIDPDRGKGDDKKAGSTPGSGSTTFAYPLNATPFSTSMEISALLDGVTVTDPCAVVSPTGAGAAAVVGAAPVGYYVVLVSTNAAGNMAMTGAMTLAAISGNQLTFAPLQNALIDLPAGFDYAFYLARVNVAGAIQLPSSVHGGV